MITCDLRGGLGNQIFQIFATLSYAIKSKNEFKFLNIDTGKFDSDYARPNSMTPETPRSNRMNEGL